MSSQQFRAPRARTRDPLGLARPPLPSRVRAVRPSRLQQDRRTTVAKVLALWPHELEEESLNGRQKRLAKLRQALRAERRRGLSGHWTYDLARHVELLRVYREELAAATSRPDDKERPAALRATMR